MLLKVPKNGYEKKQIEFEHKPLGHTIGMRPGICTGQEKRYRSIPDIFRTPYFFAKKHATFAINRDLSEKKAI